MDSITINLSQFGYSNEYELTNDGTLKNSKTGKQIHPDKLHRVSVKTAKGNTERINIKDLFRLVFDAELCEDNIQDLEGEVWKAIPNTKGKYFASSEGRIKSYCRY